MSTLNIQKSFIPKASKNLAIGLLSSFILLSGTALAGDYIPSGLSAAIPIGHVLYKKLHVKKGYGSQNYVCVQKADGNFAWSFFGPQATLFKNSSQGVTHFLSANADLNSVDKDKLQATWQDSEDTSKVWATPIALAINPLTPPPSSTPPPYELDDHVNNDAIAWLTLKVTGSLVGPTGGDHLLKTTYIQRINTKLGLAPATSLCGDVNHPIGSRSLVSYETDYLFYKLAN
jgi:hypothetical protein